MHQSWLLDSTFKEATNQILGDVKQRQPHNRELEKSLPADTT